MLKRKYAVRMYLNTKCGGGDRERRGRQWWLTGWREGLSLTQQAHVAGDSVGETALWVVW